MQPCLLCGNEFVPKLKTSVYCSGACSKKAYKIRNREKVLADKREYAKKLQAIKNADRKIVSRSCIVCSNNFVVNKYHPKQKCCSTLCNSRNFRLNNRDKVLEYKRKSNRIRADKMKVYNSVYKDQLRFSGNRLRALARDDFTCQNCGYIAPKDNTNRKYDVVVHHKDFSGRAKRPNNRMNNLQTLCRTCHIKLHTHVIRGV